MKATTINGHEVMIPEMFMRAWRRMEIQGKALLEVIPIEEMFPDISPDKISFRRVIGRDIRKVFYEVWKENPRIEAQTVEGYLRYLRER